jgi:hypothetical protein
MVLLNVGSPSLRLNIQRLVVTVADSSFDLLFVAYLRPIVGTSMAMQTREQVKPVLLPLQSQLDQHQPSLNGSGGLTN